MYSQSVSISVITVCLNSREGLRDTLDSVAAQTHPGVEHVVIDGGSRDGSRELLQQHGARLDYWHSRPDAGIYDAMNQGLRQANGDFVLFINAGDRLFAEHTLARVADLVTLDIDVVYGEVMLIDQQHRRIGLRGEVTTQRLPPRLEWTSLALGMVVSHQGFVVRRSVAPPYMDGNLCADIDWVINCLKRSRGNRRLSEPVAEFLAGGVSSRRFKRSMLDRYKVLNHHYGTGPNLLNHLRIVARRIAHSFNWRPF